MSVPTMSPTVTPSVLMSMPAPVSTTPHASMPAVTPASTSVADMSNGNVTLSSSGMVPVLTRSNFLKWQMCVRAYLTPYDHVCVIQHVKNAVGDLLDPSPLADDKELARWAQSECMAHGIMMAMAIDLHLELIHKHTDGSVWPLRLSTSSRTQVYTTGLGWAFSAATRRSTRTIPITSPSLTTCSTRSAILLL